jgi:hypothetical protein
MLSLPNLFAQHKANRKLICLLICIFSGVCFDVPAPHSWAFCISSERVSPLEFFFFFYGVYMKCHKSKSFSLLMDMKQISQRI